MNPKNKATTHKYIGMLVNLTIPKLISPRGSDAAFLALSEM